MRVATLFLGALLMASPAFALGDSVIGFCFTEPNPQACIQKFSAQEQQAREAELRRAEASQQRFLDVQLEQARLQAQGLMLFGSGPAFINGMNQGFRQMQQPYVNTPAYTYGHQ